MEDGLLLITMADNGCGMTDGQLARLMSEDTGQAKSLKFSGIGVMNVGKRVQLEYGPQYGICFENRLGHGTKVFICLPCVKRKAREHGFCPTAGKMHPHRINPLALRLALSPCVVYNG